MSKTTEIGDADNNDIYSLLSEILKELKSISAKLDGINSRPQYPTVIMSPEDQRKYLNIPEPVKGPQFGDDPKGPVFYCGNDPEKNRSIC